MFVLRFNGIIYENNPIKFKPLTLVDSHQFHAVGLLCKSLKFFAYFFVGVLRSYFVEPLCQAIRLCLVVIVVAFATIFFKLYL